VRESEEREREQALAHSKASASAEAWATERASLESELRSRSEAVDALQRKADKASSDLVAATEVRHRTAHRAVGVWVCRCRAMGMRLGMVWGLVLMCVCGL